MNKYTIKLREDWIKEKWEENEDMLSMGDVAEIFGVSTSNVYRIIKKSREE